MSYKREGAAAIAAARFVNRASLEARGRDAIVSLHQAAVGLAQTTATLAPNTSGPPPTPPTPALAPPPTPPTPALAPPATPPTPALAPPPTPPTETLAPPPTQFTRERTILGPLARSLRLVTHLRANSSTSATLMRLAESRAQELTTRASRTWSNATAQLCGTGGSASAVMDPNFPLRIQPTPAATPAAFPPPPPPHSFPPMTHHFPPPALAAGDDDQQAADLQLPVLPMQHPENPPGLAMPPTAELDAQRSLAQLTGGSFTVQSGPDADPTPSIYDDPVIVDDGLPSWTGPVECPTGWQPASAVDAATLAPTTPPASPRPTPASSSNDVWVANTSRPRPPSGPPPGKQRGGKDAGKGKDAKGKDAGKGKDRGGKVWGPNSKQPGLANYGNGKRQGTWVKVQGGDVWRGRNKGRNRKECAPQL